MTRLRIKLFGKPEVSHGDRPLSWRTRKALALLIYLVVEGGTHSRAKLATLFWPESDADAGRATLRSTLRYLRQPLAHAPEEAEPHLQVTRDALAFNFEADYHLDLNRVTAALAAQEAGAPEAAELLQQAVEMRRGYFLEGFSLPDAPAFDEWMGFQQERWQLRMAEVMERLSQIQAEAGETLAAIATARRWVAHDPLDERAYRRLMRLHLAEGDRSAALQTYEACRQTLSEELAIEPAPETRALVDRVTGSRTAGTSNGEQAIAGRGRRSAGTAAAPAQPSFPFVGRQEQHARLVEAFYRTQSEGARTALVVGESGIGKTRLAQAFLGWAEAQGAQVVQGRAFASGGRLPYQPVVEALRTVAPRLPDLLAPTWLGELARILPELHELTTGVPDPAEEEALGRAHLFEAVARLGVALARQAPLVLFVDDLQWAGAATLDLLSYATQRWQEQKAPVLFLGASRPSAMHHSAPADGLLSWLAAAERERTLVRLELERLSAQEIQQFGERATHSEVDRDRLDAFCRWLYRETGGQPFYLTETIKALLQEGRLVLRPTQSGPPKLGFAAEAGAPLSWTEADRGVERVPPGIRAVIGNRLAQLSPPAFDLVVAAALLGQRFDFQGMCQVAGLSRGDALGDLDRLLATDLLVESQQRDGLYTFTHDKIRDVVSAEAGQARRQLFHERALSYLAEKGAPAAQLAHHARGGRLYQDTFRYSLQAGNEALDMFAVAEARAHYERARRLLQEHADIREAVAPERRRRLYERLGRAYELLDEWDAATEVYEEVVGMARRTQRAALEVVGLNRLAMAKLLGKMDTESAQTLLEEALTIAEANDDRRGLAESEWGLCLSHFRSFEGAAALAHGKRAIALARELGERELLAKSLNASGYAAGSVGLWEKVEAYGEEATRLYAATGNRALEADSLLLATFARINMGRAASGVAVARKALHICREIDNEWGETNSRNHLAVGLVELGAYEEAFDVIQALFEGNRTDDTPQQMAALTVRSLVRRALGDFEGALADLLRAERFLQQRGQPHMTRVLSVHLCAAHAALGQWQEAHAQAQVALETKDFGWYYAGLHYATVIEALLHGGDEAQAEADIELMEEDVGHFPRYRIVIERSKAALSRRRGDVEGAISHLEHALHQAEALALPDEQWRLLAALAEARRAAGQEQQAERALAGATATVRELAAAIDDQALREGFLASAPG